MTGPRVRPVARMFVVLVCLALSLVLVWVGARRGSAHRLSGTVQANAVAGR